MIRLKDIIDEIVDALPPTPVPAPAAQVVPAAHGFNASFIGYIKSVENPNKVGYKNGKWYPHKSPEGGNPTIGYGHLLQKSELARANAGLTDAEVEKLLLNDLARAKKIVSDYIQNTYRVNLRLPEKTEEMLIDFAFNLGGLRAFPKFVDAVLRGQMDKARAEYQRSYQTPTGERKPVEARNRAFYDRYLK